jgi:hypothetical protein
MNTDLPFLKIEFTGKKIPGTQDEEMRFQLKGDPVLLTKAIRTVMQARQEIAAAMIAAVIDYCKEMGIDCGDLKYMVKFH